MTKIGNKVCCLIHNFLYRKYLIIVKIVNGCEVSSEIVMCKLRMLCTRENLLNILLTMEIEIKRLYCSSIS